MSIRCLIIGDNTLYDYARRAADYFKTHSIDEDLKERALPTYSEEELEQMSSIPISSEVDIISPSEEEDTVEEIERFSVNRRGLLAVAGSAASGVVLPAGFEIAIDPDRSFAEFQDYAQSFKNKDYDGRSPKSISPNEAVVDVDMVYLLTEEPAESVYFDREGLQNPEQVPVQNEEVEDGFVNYAHLEEGVYRMRAALQNGEIYEEVIKIQK